MRWAHTYYVDASPKVADVWFYSHPTDGDKSADEWRTVLVCGLRKGGKAYFALDITETGNPKLLWEFPKTTDTDTLGKVGESWSEPAIGRVKVEVENKLVERWVAFVGGGFDKNESHSDANVGRAFYVIDIKTGEILWEYSYAKDQEEKNRMTHSFPASPKAVDIDFDGFVDKVYIGDRGGQLWVFDVFSHPVTQKSNSLWSGRRLFQAPKVAPEKHPIYYQPTVALDLAGIPWVFFGTGDRERPADKNSRERFYAVKDDEQGPYPYEEKDLADVTTNNTFSQDRTRKGWYIKLERAEKVLAKPTVFNRLLYFTTYTHNDNPDPCSGGGTGRLYVVEYQSGGGATDFSDMAYALGQTSARFETIGGGAPSAPVISVSLQGKANITIGTTLGTIYSEELRPPSRRNEILYWRDVVR